MVSTRTVGHLKKTTTWNSWLDCLLMLLEIKTVVVRDYSPVNAWRQYKKAFRIPRPSLFIKVVSNFCCKASKRPFARDAFLFARNAFAYSIFEYLWKERAYILQTALAERVLLICRLHFEASCFQKLSLPWGSPTSSSWYHKTSCISAYYIFYSPPIIFIIVRISTLL